MPGFRCQRTASAGTPKLQPELLDHDGAVGEFPDLRDVDGNRITGSERGIFGNDDSGTGEQDRSRGHGVGAQQIFDQGF